MTDRIDPKYMSWRDRAAQQRQAWRAQWARRRAAARGDGTEVHRARNRMRGIRDISAHRGGPQR